MDYRAKGGDLAQYYRQGSANPGMRTIEKQDPVLLAGYHREWGPGNHTIFLGARIDDTQTVRDPAHQIVVVTKNTNGTPSGVAPGVYQEYYQSKLTVYSAELQQIFETPKHTTVLGARVQAG